MQRKLDAEPFRGALDSCPTLPVPSHEIILCAVRLEKCGGKEGGFSEYNFLGGGGEGVPNMF